MDGIWQDIRFAARGLRRDRGFAAFVIATLTLGIGANAAMFGIVDRLLLSGPRHVRDANDVVRVYLSAEPPGMRKFVTDGFGNVTYDVLRGHVSSFTGFATYAIDQTFTGTGAEAQPIRAGYASASMFPVLGVQPERGRFFNAEEDRPSGAERVAVLSYGVWQSLYAGASDVIGKTMPVGNDVFTVVGVAPRGFTGPQLGPVDVWLPMNLKSPRITTNWQTSWNAQWLQIVGRLAPGVTAARANEELTAVFRRGYTGDEPYVANGQVFVAGLSANEGGAEPPAVSVVRWLSAVAAIVLLIACANVANLLLARGMRRSREVALRTALGARAWRVVRLLLAESMLLAGGGALGGIALAYFAGDLARRQIFAGIDWSTSPVDGRVLIASMAIAIVTGLVVGLLPAWRAVQTNLIDALKTGVREGRGQRSRARHALTIAQAALSVILLVGAGLFVRSLWNAYTLPLGLDPDRVLTVEINWPPLSRFPNDARAGERLRRTAFSRDAVDVIRHVPGVTQASVAVGMPFGNRFTLELRVPGLAAVPRLKTGSPSVSAVADDYFSTVGTRIVRGRAFGPGDHAGTEPVAIVSQTMADTVWPRQDAMGRCFYSGKDATACATIVGVAEDTHQSSLKEPPSMHYYIPFGQEVGIGGTTLLVRSAEDPHLLGPAIRRALAERDPTIPNISFSTVRDHIDPQTQSWRIGATVFSVSGLLALIVAAIGLYSVMSYLVADRTHEIGVRLALGARSADIARLILSSSVGMAVIGVVLGSMGAVAASRAIEDLLFNESPRDPWVYVSVAAILLAVAVVAGVVPTMRARRIEAVTALRAD